jgi:hypothetical protein
VVTLAMRLATQNGHGALESRNMMATGVWCDDLAHVYPDEPFTSVG